MSKFMELFHKFGHTKLGYYGRIELHDRFARHGLAMVL